MNPDEQTRDSFMEALIEIMQRFLDYLKELSGEKVEKKELSDNAKDLLNTLKKDPELTKNLIQQYAIEKVEQNTDTFKQLNDKILNQITEIKKGIDLTTDEGKEQFDKLEKLEKIQLDKEESIKEKIYRLLVLASERNDNEGQNALNLAEKLIQKYSYDKDEILEKGNNDLNRTNEVKESKYLNHNRNENIIENERYKNNVFHNETIYIDKEPIENDNKTNWILENKTSVTTREVNSDTLTTSEKLKYLEEKGVDISRLHSRISVNKEFEKQLEFEKKYGEKPKENEVNKEQTIEREEITMER